MAFLQCSFHSEALRLACSMNVILPQPAGASQIGISSASAADDGHGPPVLYLLHGLSDDHTIWMRRTAIERYAAPLGLAVIMPAANRSFYTDMAVGPKYWTFISQELPVLCHRMFRLSSRRQDTFVAGLSMGGYGAFKLALRQPERFAAAASLSGALDMAYRIEARDDDPQWIAEKQRIFGGPDGLPGSENDLMHLASQLAATAGPKPRLFQCCGSEDFLIEHNHRFRDHATGLGLDLTYHEHEGEGHSWGYWDRTIRDVLAWLPLEHRA